MLVPILTVEGHCRSKGQALFPVECCKAFCKLPQSSDLFRFQKELSGISSGSACGVGRLVIGGLFPM